MNKFLNPDPFEAKMLQAISKLNSYKQDNHIDKQKSHNSNTSSYYNDQHETYRRDQPKVGRNDSVSMWKWKEV